MSIHATSPRAPPPPGIAGSISRGSFRDTRVANDFSPFGSVHDFNAATRQMAPAGSPFLHGVRPGSLHTNGTPMHRGIDQTLSRRGSMDSFYADAPATTRGRPPHPDDVFSDHGSAYHGSQYQGSQYQESQYHGQGTPYVAQNHLSGDRSPQIAMSIHKATPEQRHELVHPDDQSERYGSLYAAPYAPVHRAPSLNGQDITHKQSFQTTNSKLSRGTKLTKKSGLSGFSFRRKPRGPSVDEGSQLNGTPYMGHNASIISEFGNVHQTPKPSRSPSIMSQHQEIHHARELNRSQSVLSARPSTLKPETIQVHDPPSLHGHESFTPAANRPLSMMESIRSIHKAPPGTFPFEREGDDIIAQVWLPWTERLQDGPCHFHVDGMYGERYWLEVDYRWTKAINGTVKFHGGGIQRSGSYGRGKFIVEWEIGFQFEPELPKAAVSDGLFRNPAA